MTNDSLNSVHEELKTTMKKEVHLMREILANMHQEEVALLLNDKGSWNHVMQQRYYLVERLSDFRAARVKATSKLEKIVCQDSHLSCPSLEQLLPSESEESCEILSLSDQIVALAERMNSQNFRNTGLVHQIEHQLSIPHETRHYPMQHQEELRAKKKVSIATYQIKK